MLCFNAFQQQNQHVIDELGQAARMNFDLNDIKIGVVGLGYVGLPLAVEFGRKYPTVGFDIKASRIEELLSGTDSTLEVPADELSDATQLKFSSSVKDLSDCNFYIVTVPTPVGSGNRPLLTPLRNASMALSAILKEGDIVVYESTVYPGAPEEFCIPFLEKGSGLKLLQLKSQFSCTASVANFFERRLAGCNPHASRAELPEGVIPSSVVRPAGSAAFG